MPDDPPRIADLAVALREVAWAIHRKAPDRAGAGPIPTTEVAVLKQIIETPDCTVGDVAAALGLRQPNASAALRNLMQRGFVHRRTSQTDRRIAHLVATEAGIAEHRAIAQAWAEPVLSAIASLTDDEVAALSAASPALDAILRHLRAGSGDGPAERVTTR